MYRELSNQPHQHSRAASSVTLHSLQHDPLAGQRSHSAQSSYPNPNELQIPCLPSPSTDDNSLISQCHGFPGQPNQPEVAIHITPVDDQVHEVLLKSSYAQSTSPKSTPSRSPTGDSKETEVISVPSATAIHKEHARGVWAHERDMVRRWKDEIDSQLLMAGLFSTVITAFNVEYYRTLKPSADISDAIQQLSEQMSNFTSNSTEASTAAQSIQKAPTSSATCINAFWFSSLVLTLATGSIGILVKQWLNNYTDHIPALPNKSVLTWHERSTGLAKWRVGRIIAILPVLLQIAIALFLVGLVQLLWTLSAAVFGIVFALVAALLLFSISSAVIPSIMSDCPYRSPQAWLLFALVRRPFMSERPTGWGDLEDLRLQCAEDDNRYTKALHNAREVISSTTVLSATNTIST